MYNILQHLLWWIVYTDRQYQSPVCCRQYYVSIDSIPCLLSPARCIDGHLPLFIVTYNIERWAPYTSQLSPTIYNDILPPLSLVDATVRHIQCRLILALLHYRIFKQLLCIFSRPWNAYHYFSKNTRITLTRNISTISIKC